MRSDQSAQVVVITGASAGVGRAVAEAYARRGASIGLLARGEDGLEGARQSVEALGGKAIAIPTDVADADAVERAAAQVEATFGPIDVWVNDAMTSVFSPVKEMTPDEFTRVTEVTYLGYVYGTMAALKRMLPRDRGVIVQVGSALAYRAIPLQAAYCGAKHAIRGFSDSLRCELLHDKSAVRVVMVQMPALNTPQFGWVRSRLPNNAQPVPPIYEPEVAAEAVLWAAEHEKRELNVGWSAVEAVWGNKFFPGLLDRYLARKGYAGQQTDKPQTPHPDDLDRPVDDRGDRGAHGAFDDRARAHSTELWITTHRRTLAVAGGAIAAAGTALWRKDR